MQEIIGIKEDKSPAPTVRLFRLMCFGNSHLLTLHALTASRRSLRAKRKLREHDALHLSLLALLPTFRSAFTRANIDDPLIIENPVVCVGPTPEKSVKRPPSSCAATRAIHIFSPPYSPVRLWSIRKTSGELQVTCLAENWLGMWIETSTAISSRAAGVAPCTLSQC